MSHGTESQPDRAGLLDAARVAVLRASHVCRLVQSSLDRVRAITKDDQSPVTVADFAAQAVVAMTLRERLGPFALIAEESSAFLRDPSHHSHLDAALHAARQIWPDMTADVLLDAIDLGNHHLSGSASTSPAGVNARGHWTLDPIDGTKGFLRGHQYAVCLAYIVGADPIVAALGCPNLPIDHAAPLDSVDPRGSVYLAIKSTSGTISQAPCVLPASDSSHVPPTSLERVRRTSDECPILVESFEPSHSRQEAASSIMQRVIAGLARDGSRASCSPGTTAVPTVRVDSQCKYALVARGQADVYLRLPSKRGYIEKIWDHASGSLVASQAGCIVTDARGRALDFSCGAELTRNRGIVVAPPGLHDRVIRAIAELGMSEEAPSR